MNLPRLKTSPQLVGLQWLGILMGLGVFALLSLLLALLLPSSPPPIVLSHHIAPAARPAPGSAHTFLAVNVLAALLAMGIAPYLFRSFEQMQQRMARQTSELRSLHAIDNAINAELKLESILAVSVKEAALAVDGERAALWLFSGDGAGAAAGPPQPAAEAFYNVAPDAQNLLRERLEESEIDHVRRSGVPQRRNDLEAQWRTDLAARALRLRNRILVPIRQQGAPAGVLLVGNRGGTLNPLEGFTDDDQELLVAIAATIAVAVQNARLYQESQQRGEMLRSLVARTGDAIAASSDAPRLMQILADEAARILDCPRVAVYVFDEAQEVFVPLAAHDRSTQAGSAFGTFYRQPLDGETVLAAAGKMAAETGGERRPAPYCANVRQCLGLGSGEADFLDAPGCLFLLRARDRRRIGLLCLLDGAPRAQTPEMETLAQALAAQAAVALENAQLSQQTHDLLARTRALQSATQQVAAGLDTDRVIQGVMDSARSVLDADGYVLWDCDVQSGEWTRRAAFGLHLAADPEQDTASGEAAAESELLTRVLRERVPLPISGLAGDGLPADSAVRALLALPLLYAGQAAGVMVLCYKTPRVFVPDEVGLAQSFAHQAANALENARLFARLSAAYERERRIAETLQQSLLPPIPKRAGDFELAYKYQAALEEAVIGGDCFDLFDLGRDRIGVVIADVSGKGLKAAVQTAMVKYTLRSFAHEMPESPGRVLARVNHVLSSGLNNLEGFVTLFYGVLDIHTGRLLYASSGHEPPVLVEGNGPAHPVEVSNGVALGVMKEADYPESELLLPPGALLLLYTDGVTEARTLGGPFLELKGLMAIVERQVPAAASGPAGRSPVETMADAIFEDVRRFAGGVLRDDVAMLLLHRVT